MKDIDFSQFQGVWEASRLLENICLYKAMFGTPPFYNVKTDDNEERPLKRVMRERIISVLKAYDKYGRYIHPLRQHKGYLHSL